MRPILLFLAAALVAAGALVACGDTEPAEPITFGEGTIPSTVPADFPVPGQSRIGTTLVDRVNNKTEFTLNAPLPLAEAIDFFLRGLVEAGYVVASSSDIGALWEIEFVRDELAGHVRLQGMNPSLTQIVVSMNRS